MSSRGKSKKRALNSYTTAVYGRWSTELMKYGCRMNSFEYICIYSKRDQQSWPLSPISSNYVYVSLEMESINNKYIPIVRNISISWKNFVNRYKVLCKFARILFLAVYSHLSKHSTQCCKGNQFNWATFPSKINKYSLGGYGSWISFYEINIVANMSHSST